MNLGNFQSIVNKFAPQYGGWKITGGSFAQWRIEGIPAWTTTGGQGRRKLPLSTPAVISL